MMKAAQTTRKATPFLIAALLVVVAACVAAVTFAFTAFANDGSDTDTEEVLIIEPTADAVTEGGAAMPESIAGEAAEELADPAAAEEPAVEDAVPEEPAETIPVADELYESVAEDAEDASVTDTSTQEVLVPYGAVAIDSDETIDIDVNIVWNDDNNRDGRRPASVTVQLWADGDPLDDGITLEGTDEENTWTGTFTDLPRYVDGGTTEIVYTIEEVEVSYYNTAIEGSAEEGFTITSTHEPELMSIKFTVHWSDSDDQDGIRPESVTIPLLADDTVVDELEVSADDEWTGTFTNKYKYENGNRISYRPSEILPDGYEALIMGDAGSEFEIINRHTPEKYDETGELTVTIEWDDADNRDGLRDDYEITLTGTINGDEGDEVVYTESQTLSADQDSYTFTGLYKYSSGSEIVYTIEETVVPAGYAATVDGFTITNHELFNGDGTATITKIWDDDNDRDGLRDDYTVTLTGTVFDAFIVYDAQTLSPDITTYTWENLYKYENDIEISYTVEETHVPDGYSVRASGSLATNNRTFTNSHTPAMVNGNGEITVIKVWDDAGNQDGLRDDYEITLTGTVNGDEVVYSESQILIAHEDSYTFTGLYRNSGGSEITYTIEETSVPAGYEATIAGSVEDGFTVTNHELYNGDGEITVTKQWGDHFDQDGLRTDCEITLTGTINGDEVVYTESQALSTDDRASCRFTGLYKYSNESEITYTVEETSVPYGYASTVDGFTITNYELFNGNGEITVTKIWDDDENYDGIRSSYTVTLIGIANDEQVVSESQTLSADQDSYTFTGLYKYYIGSANIQYSRQSEITYTVEETVVPYGYDSTVDGFVITNSHTPELVNGNGEITVTKIWEDADNRDGLRDSYEITLTGTINGDEVVYTESQTLSADQDSYTFTGLYRYLNDSEITYTVEETSVPYGYDSTVDGFTITNHELVNGDGKITVTKIWDDDNDRDGLRGEYEVTLRGMDNRGGSFQESVTLDPETTTYTWKNQYKYLYYGNDDYFEIIYAVYETSVPAGYSGTIVDSDPNHVAEGFVLTNTHEAELYDGTGELTVTKVWDDDNDRDGLRDSYTVTLTGTADGEEVVSEDVTLTADQDLYTFTGLYKNYDGTEIEYSIAETSVPEGYEAIVDDTVADGFTVTNTHEIELLNGDGILNVSKQWDDNDDALGVRPDSVSVQLLANGEPVEGAILTLSADNGWSASFSDLPANENGSAIEYSATEADPISYYDLSVESVTSDESTVSLVLTNTLTLSFSPLDEEIVTDESDPDSWVKQESVNEYNAIEFEMSTMLPAVAGTDLLEGDFTLLFHDQLQSGLMLDASDPDFRVTIGGAAISSQYYTIDILTSDTSSISSLAAPEDDCSFHVTVDLSALYADGVITDEDLTGNTEVGVYFFADLEGTDINGSFTSTAWYQVYSGDTVLYTSNTDVVEVYTFEIVVLKYDATTLEGTDYADSGLAGATLGVFYDEACTNAVQRNGVDFRVVSGEDGYAVFNGLAEGTYYVRELAAPEGYILSDEVAEVTLADGLADNIFSLTFANTFDSSEPEPEPEPVPPEPAETIDIMVSIVWEDNDNAADARPDLVVVVLMKNGKATTETLILNEENGWTATFEGLEAYTDGEENVYTIADVTIPYYTSTITGDQESGFTVTSIFVADEGYIDGGNDGNGDNGGNGGNGGNNGNNGNNGNGGTGTTGGTGNGSDGGITQTGQNDLPIAPLAASAAILLAAGVTALVIWRRRAA